MHPAVTLARFGAPALEKSAVVKQDPETGKWILWTKDGKRKLGTHKTAEDAYKQEYAIQKSMEKTAAEMKRKTRTVEQHSNHCPHCDFEFREKCYTVLKDKGERVRRYDKAYETGEYDEHCPACDGIIDQKDMTDEEIEDGKGVDYPGRKEAEKTRREAQRRRKAERTAQLRKDNECEHGVCVPYNTCDYGCKKPMEKKADMWTGDAEVEKRLAEKELEYARTIPDYVAKFKGTLRGTWPEVQHAITLLEREGQTKSALRPISERMDRLRARRGECRVCGKPNQEGKICDCEPEKSASATCPCAQASDSDIYTCRCYGNPMIKSKGWEKSAKVSRTAVADAMTAAGIPRDVYFFVGDGGKATAYFGDWHPKEVWTVTNKIGRKFFSNYEEPDDSEIGRPEWATKETISSKATGKQVLDNIPHKCAETTCRSCGKSWKSCADLIDSKEDLAKHEAKIKKTVERCKSCEIAHQERRDGLLPMKQASIMSRLDLALREGHKPMTQEELLERGSCCGNGCKNCPYPVKRASVASRLRAAINQTHTHPTPAQAAAGNYRCGEFKFRQGLTIKIENPEGTTRKGVSKSGKAWSSLMKCSYGYFKGSKGKDGDPVDVFLGEDLDSDVVAIIDQEIDGKFDEHKVLVAVKSEEQARKLYLSNYERGWKCGPITMTSVEGLKEWLKTGDTKKPFSGQQKEAAWWHREPRPAKPKDDMPEAHLGCMPRMIGHLLKVSFGSAKLVPPPTQKPKR